MKDNLPTREVVLLGIGHTNAHVLRMWRMQPPRDVRLTCVSDRPIATYSGMLPGVLAGQYPPDRMEMDLVRLCAAASARLVVDRVTGLDVQARTLLFAQRPPLPFDLLSIGIGSIPYGAVGHAGHETVLAIKPMQTFMARLDDRLACLSEQCRGREVHVVIVGGGAGGVELTFCLPNRIRAAMGKVAIKLTLIQSDARVLPGMRSRTVHLVEQELAARGVELRTGCRVARSTAESLVLDDGQEIPADLVLWATHAVAPPLLANLGLPLDEDGFLLTRSTLMTTADAPIFAVGDSGTIEGRRTPKAGVYAVRQGPVLWRNIQRSLRQQPLISYVPQHSFLKLLNTGEGRAIAEYKGLSWHSRWCWKLKDAIDGRFIDKYQDYRPMEMAESESQAVVAMRCTGCGGKVSGAVLSRVLSRLQIPDSPHVMLGLESPDDAAIVRPPGGRPVAATVDFFAAPLTDAYLAGRIAALNALSDVFALGAKPLAALAMATIPVGPDHVQEQVLLELLSGSLDEFRRVKMPLVGGHTIEGPQLTVGFTILADLEDGTPRTKDCLRVGDHLVLTKPLGTGILLAAHMQVRCRASWMQALLDTMLQSNQPPTELFQRFDIAGVTDITGFGLAGHLLEMLRASEVAAQLDLDAIAVLPGVEQLVSEGVESTLAPANRLVEAEMEVSQRMHKSGRYRALFDPQTSGGLLLGVAESNVASLLAELDQQGMVNSSVIGQVVAHQPGRPRLRVCFADTQVPASPIAERL